MENKKKKNKGIIVAFVVIIIFTGFAVLNYARAIKQKVEKTELENVIPVSVAESRIMNIRLILSQIGNIHPGVEVDVYPKISGRIIEDILIEKGDFVKKGDMVAVLEDDTIQAQIEEANAALESAKAALKQAEANHEVLAKDRERLENLYKEKAVARQRLDHIEAQFKTSDEAKKLAGAQVKRAEAAMKQLRIIYRDHKIYAPISGYVTDRYVDPGALSAPGKPIIHMSSEDVLKIVTTVTEKDFPHIKKGMPVEIRVDAFPEKVFTGGVSIINPAIDPDTRTGEIEIHIKNVDRMLRPGMFARIQFYLGQKQAVVIPREALVKLPGTGNYYVFVVENEKAVQKNIDIGINEGNFVEVVSGLDKEEQIVITGINRLRDGTVVKVRDDKNMLIRKEGSANEPS